MNILFIGTTGIHHVLLAAHEYLGIAESDLRRLKFWGDYEREARGQPLFLNYDNLGNKVFSVGVGKNLNMAEKSISQLLQILNVSEQDIVVRPIYSRYDRIWLWLSQLQGWALTRGLAEHIILVLLNRDALSLKNQIEKFKKEVR